MFDNLKLCFVKLKTERVYLLQTFLEFFASIKEIYEKYRFMISKVTISIGNEIKDVFLIAIFESDPICFIFF